MSILLAVTMLVQGGAPSVGDRFLLTHRYETQRADSGGQSSGSSHGTTTIVERVVAVRLNGIVLEYDLPDDATAQDRAREWQYPARVLRPAAGPSRLLNRQALEDRLTGWLKATNPERSACDRWYFTWNLFRIECDPDSVVATIDAFDPDHGTPRAGGIYADDRATAPGIVRRMEDGDVVATLTIDPVRMAERQAGADRAVAEVTGDAALRNSTASAPVKHVTGTITATFVPGPDGRVRRRTVVLRSETRDGDDAVERTTQTETVERTRIPR